jgi:hypothetical protein
MMLQTSPWQRLALARCERHPRTCVLVFIKNQRPKPILVLMMGPQWTLPTNQYIPRQPIYPKTICPKTSAIFGLGYPVICGSIVGDGSPMDSANKSIYPNFLIPKTTPHITSHTDSVASAIPSFVGGSSATVEQEASGS